MILDYITDLSYNIIVPGEHYSPNISTRDLLIQITGLHRLALATPPPIPASDTVYSQERARLLNSFTPAEVSPEKLLLLQTAQQISHRYYQDKLLSLGFPQDAVDTHMAQTPEIYYIKPLRSTSARGITFGNIIGVVIDEQDGDLLDNALTQHHEIGHFYAQHTENQQFAHGLYLVTKGEQVGDGLEQGINRWDEVDAYPLFAQIFPQEDKARQMASRFGDIHTTLQAFNQGPFAPVSLSSFLACVEVLKNPLYEKSNDEYRHLRHFPQLKKDNIRFVRFMQELATRLGEHLVKTKNLPATKEQFQPLGRMLLDLSRFTDHALAYRQIEATFDAQTTQSILSMGEWGLELNEIMPMIISQQI